MFIKNFFLAMTLSSVVFVVPSVTAADMPVSSTASPETPEQYREGTRQLVRQAEDLQKRILAAEEYAKKIAFTKGRIEVNAPELTPAQIERVRIVAAQKILQDPVAAQIMLGSGLRTLVKPFQINIKADEKRCWTNGEVGFSLNGKEGCAIKIDLGLHHGYEDMLENCLLHEVAGHGVGYMRCGAAYDAMPRWVQDGTAILEESAQKRAAIYKALKDVMVKEGGRLPFTIEELNSIQAYPPEKEKLYRFYNESLALADMLTTRLNDRSGPEKQKGDYMMTILYFGLTARQSGMPAALRQYYDKLGIKNVGDLDQLLRGWITEQNNELP